MNKAYLILLGLYPRDYRVAFAAEMRTAFNVTLEERRSGGRASLARFAVGELASLAVGAASEWIAKLTTDPSIRGRSLPDIVKMRPPGVSREAHFR